MHRVKPLCLGFREPGHAQSQYFEAGPLDHGQNLAGLARGHGIRLNHRKGSFRAHKPLFTFSPRSAGLGENAMPAFDQIMARISPAWPAATASGLIIEKVRSMLISGSSLFLRGRRAWDRP